MRRNYRFALAFLVSLGVAAGVTGCGSDAAAQAEAKADAKDPAGAEPSPVEVALAESGSITPNYPTTATLESEREATIVSESSGELEAVLVEEGQMVKKGQVLARLESRRERLERARAAADANRLSNESERGATLASRGLVSHQAAEQTQFAKESQQATLHMMELALAKKEIRAPYDGIVTRRYAKTGLWLNAGEPAFGLADLSTLTARINVPERAAASLESGQAAVLESDAFPGATFNGHIERISPVVDRQSGTVGATIALDRNDVRLRPGLFVRLNVQYATLEGITLVPKSSVQRDQGQTRVFVVRDGKVQARTVTLGLEHGEQVQAATGVTPGESVVTVGLEKLVDGDKVTVVDTRAAVANATAVAAN